MLFVLMLRHVRRCACVRVHFADEARKGDTRKQQLRCADGATQVAVCCGPVNTVCLYSDDEDRNKVYFYGV